MHLKDANEMPVYVDPDKTASECAESMDPDQTAPKGRLCPTVYHFSGFIRVREMSGKFKNFQGQGIVREFHNLSGKIEFLLICQGNVREF